MIETNSTESTTDTLAIETNTTAVLVTTTTEHRSANDTEQSLEGDDSFFTQLKKKWDEIPGYLKAILSISGSCILLCYLLMCCCRVCDRTRLEGGRNYYGDTESDSYSTYDGAGARHQDYYAAVGGAGLEATPLGGIPPQPMPYRYEYPRYYQYPATSYGNNGMMAPPLGPPPPPPPHGQAQAPPPHRMNYAPDPVGQYMPEPYNPRY